MEIQSLNRVLLLRESFLKPTMDKLSQTQLLATTIAFLLNIYNKYLTSLGE